MSVNPEKRTPEDAATDAAVAPESAPGSESTPDVPAAAASEPAPVPAPAADIPADLFVEPAAPPAPVESVAPAPEPAPSPAPPPEPETPLALEPARRVRATPAPAPRPTPSPQPAPPLSVAPEPAPVSDYNAVAESGRGDFDAVFEARSDTGLGDRLLPTACYLMMVIGPLFLGLSAIPAAVLAYMNRETSPKWVQTHFIYQIRTFWAGVLMALIAGGTFFFFDRGVLGVIFGAVWAVVMLFGVVWFVLRSATGLLRLRRGEPIKRPHAWSF